MPSNPRILDLVQEILVTNRAPEEVCADHPELLWEVHERLKRAQLLEAELAELFPVSIDAPVGSGKPCYLLGDVLPEIPGYELEKIISHGGVGVVFKARHRKLNRLVALKMLLSGAFASRQESARFIREAEAVAGLQHPHIVQVHDVGEFERRPYFTMEFVEGGTLAQQLAGTPQPAAYSAQLVATLATAVAFAHGHGIVHRDLKPANILLAADGTPKIADFGLARRVDRDQGITLSGVRLGTPSYMAPEQASGKSHAAGPSVDVYALGAILYEMLTGRPPFRAATSSETERQVIAEEPARPSRLNSSVPRDLENICLKCLSKDPRRRYTRAEDLSDDLQRFLDGKPVLARPIGWPEQIWKWVRRRPTQAILLAAITIGVVSLATATVWWSTERAATIRAIDGDLAVVAQKESLEDWVAARTALDRAKVRIGNLVLKTELARIGQAERELDLAAALGDIRLNRAIVVGAWLDPQADKARADRDYAATFQAAGFGEPLADAESTAGHIRNSAVARVLIAALDDWANCTTDEQRRAWLLDVATRADSDANAWIRNVREPTTWLNRAELAELAQSAPVDMQPIQLMTMLAERLQQAGGDTVPFLTRVQASHSGDFWANSALGAALLEKNDSAAAERYFQAALAVRPRAAVAHNNMGMALARSGKSGQISAAIPYLLEAIHLNPQFGHAHSNLGNCYKLTGKYEQAVAEYLEALRIDPTSPVVHSNLGTALEEMGRLADAIHEYEMALRLNPKYVVALCNLGSILRKSARFDEAVGYLRRAVAIGPDFADAHHKLGAALMAARQFDEGLRELREALRLQPDSAQYHSDVGAALVELGQTDEGLKHYRRALSLHPDALMAINNLRQALIQHGRMDQVRTFWQRAIDAAPPHFEAWDGYAELCLFLDRQDEYHRTCQTLVDRFGGTDDPRIAARIALACLLSPATNDVQNAAAVLIERAASAQTAAKGDDLILAQALLAYRQKRPHDALKLLSDKAGALSAKGTLHWIVAAMALHRLGNIQQARKVLATAIDSTIWSEQVAVNREGWIGNLLRRESERLMLPHLDEFLKGSYRPVDNDERLAMSGACYFRHFNRALAQLYVDAFAADPGLAANRSIPHRYNAACVAALAAAGKGADTANLSDIERAHWREQARQWLQAELAAQVTVLKSGSAADGKRAMDWLAGWFTDSDLAGLRDPMELRKLPAAERARCQKFWDAVGGTLNGKREAK
jgi:eukaryotic-like serine/threonine-protein kinase